MRRRTPGRPFRLDFPEFHVDCAHEDCPASCLLTESGRAWTVRQAETHARAYGPDEGQDEGPGWTRHHGRWWCPAHGHATTPGRRRP